MERPFSDDEKRFVLAEAIKRSTIPVGKLFDLVHEYFPAASWPLNDMVFPNGRTPNQCKDVFENLRNNSSVPSFHTQPQSQNQIQSPTQSHLIPISSVTSSAVKRKSTSGSFESYSPGPAQKRRQSSADPVTTARHRDIHPKPSNTGSPLSQAPFPTSEPKKRGRPSKKDVERKQQEAIARGEVLPLVSSSSMMSYQSQGEDVSTPGYLPILPAIAPALSYSPSPGLSIERENPESAGSPGKQRRTKAIPKSSKSASKQPGESSFKVNPTISSMIESDQTQGIPSIAESMSIPVAGAEGARTVPNNFTPASPAPPPTMATPNQQASDT
ncbi:hypothetical protein VTL71DRAFT_8080 [Oculimacula yallundae]|uniref:Myb-like domain-containing protein n=1 Tax=Oculimacula yallundae TaxID=86028 RepID=A0ABR4CWS8_9HELO